jgi:hypothetical protein
MNSAREWSFSKGIPLYGNLWTQGKRDTLEETPAFPILSLLLQVGYTLAVFKSSPNQIHRISYALYPWWLVAQISPYYTITEENIYKNLSKLDSWIKASAFTFKVDLSQTKRERCKKAGSGHYHPFLISHLSFSWSTPDRKITKRSLGNLVLASQPDNAIVGKNTKLFSYTQRDQTIEKGPMAKNCSSKSRTWKF